MKYAMTNDVRIEATPGAKGTCPSCGSLMIAKCGLQKIPHWAHKAIRNCDPWWENETEWHRLWKGSFHDRNQEVIMRDEQTDEKHIADVRTDHGLVIEFQHSAIKMEERIAREEFYRTMVWIVDGTRLDRDYPRFLKGKSELSRVNNQEFFLVEFADECFPKTWIESSVPVIFDFKGLASIEDIGDDRNFLYCLYPKRNGKSAILERMTKDFFIEAALNGLWIQRIQNFTNSQANITNRPQQPRFIIRKRESSFILERGRWKRRKRL